MLRRAFGKTGLEVCVLGFGCGAVGGLMVRGAPADQERTVAHAIELGVNYFDTAPGYGDGASERNLGQVLRKLKPDVIVGTKVRIPDSDKGAIGKAIAAGMDASLGRLGCDSVDLFQLHNPITTAGQGSTIAVQAVLDEAVPAFERLRSAGKTRFFGVTAIGDTAALHRLVDAGVIHSGQVAHNLLNPSPGGAVPAGFPAQDYDRLLDRCLATGIGTIGIRALAGGALSGEAARHPIASPAPEPIGSAASYDADLSRARRFLPLVKEGHASSLVELALRFVISHPGLSTMLIGIATPQQFQTAADALAKGPLPAATLVRIAELHKSFAGEKR